MQQKNNTKFLYLILVVAVIIVIVSNVVSK